MDQLLLNRTVLRAGNQEAGPCYAPATNKQDRATCRQPIRRTVLRAGNQQTGPCYALAYRIGIWIPSWEGGAYRIGIWIHLFSKSNTPFVFASFNLIHSLFRAYIRHAVHGLRKDRARTVGHQMRMGHHRRHGGPVDGDIQCGVLENRFLEQA